MKKLTDKQKEQMAMFLDRWLKTWSKNKEKGVYGNLWKIFSQMKNSGINNKKEFKQLGGFGLHLLNGILYGFQEYDDDIREENEPHLIEAVIALHLLISYLQDELEILKDVKLSNKYKL